MGTEPQDTLNTRVTHETDSEGRFTYAELRQAERLPGIDLDPNSRLSVQILDNNRAHGGEVDDYIYLQKINGNLSRRVALTALNGTASEVWVSSNEFGGRRNEVRISLPQNVYDAVQGALGRAMQSGAISPTDMARIEKLRQTIASSVVDDSTLETREQQAIIRRASVIGR